MARKKTQEEKDYDVILADVREMLKTGVGTQFIWDILSFANIYGDAFTGNSQTFYLEGKRSVGLYVLQLLEDADPTAYARLLLDKQKRKEGRDERTDDSSDAYTDTDNG